MKPTTEQLKDLLAKVAPGPWEEITPEGGIWPPRVFSGSTIVCMVDNSDMTHGEKVANATLMALAPTLAAEVVRLRDAIEGALSCLQFEINPSNYDHGDACRLNDNSCEAYAILAESICMGDGHARQALDATSEK